MERCLEFSTRLLVVMACVIAVLACQQQAAMTPVTDKAAIIGKWEESGETVEIFEDGRIVHTDRLKKRTTGRYDFIDNNIIRIAYDGFEKQDYKASIYQAELLLTGVDDSTTARLKRVQ